MQLSVDKHYFYGQFMGYAVFKKSFFRGWELYDTLRFQTYEEALIHAKNIKSLSS